MLLLKRLGIVLVLVVMLATACLPENPMEPTATPGSVQPAPTAGPTALPSVIPTATLPPAKLSPLFEAGISNEPLAVVSTQPPDKATGVTVDKAATRLMVQFNHPVVPLTSVEAQRSLPQAIRIEPALAGAGEWLNTSTFLFTPSQDLAPATAYTATLGPLRDVLGMDLAAATFSFRTAAPAVVQSSPGAGGQNVAVSLPISLTFNAEMDRTSTEGRTTLTGGGATVRGRFDWTGAKLSFVPEKALSYDTQYTLRIAAGALASSRQAATTVDYVLTFRTVAQPAVLATSPADGSRDATQQRSAFLVTFASPMDPNGLQVSIVPTITNQRSSFRYDFDGTRAQIAGNWLPSQTYVVTIGAQSKTREGERLGRDVVVRFTTAASEPQFYFTVPNYTNFGMYDAGVPTVVYGNATNVASIDYRLYRVPLQDVLRLISRDKGQTWNRYSGIPSNLVRQWSQSVSAPLNTGRLVSTTLSTAPGGLLAPGTYYLEATPAGAAVARHLLFVTSRNLALKHTDEEALVWVTDLATGKPVEGQPLTIFDPLQNQIGSGKSDRDGIYRARFSSLTDVWGSLYALSEVDGQVVAIAGSDWQNGIAPWDFGLSASRQFSDYFGNLYTDRPIYRPGQSVYFKGILRKDNDASYSLPDLAGVSVQMRDSDYRLVYSNTLKVGPFGTIDGEILLSPSAAVGDYYMALEVNSRFIANAYVQVAEYRAPDFQVGLTTDKSEYLNGETIKVDAASTYFFGGSVTDAAVTWRLMSYAYGFAPDTVKGWWDFVDWDPDQSVTQDSKVIRDGKGKTDAQGHFRLDLPADVNEYSQSRTFQIEVEVSDINNQSVASRTTVVVHRGKFYIGLRPQKYVGAVGQEQAVDVITLDTKGVTVTNQALTAEVYRRQWYSVREKQADGNLAWRSSFTDTLVTQSSVTTGATGAAVVRFTPAQGGTYRILAKGTDAPGNPIRSATFLWVSSGEFVGWRTQDNDRIELVADRKQYAPGDTAEILIPAPFAQAETLLTMERGSIREVRRLYLAGNAERIQIPIRDDHAPNIFVSVILVKGRGADGTPAQFKLGYVNLPVSAASRELTVTLTADKAKYAPGDRAEFNVTASDSAGKPAQAEFSLALVDKAVQSLADDRSVSPVSTFWGQRGLAVVTAASLNKSMERVNQTIKADGGKGGGGGLLTQSPRKEFRDTAYWGARVVTDASGRASVTVSLPDNLTTWNMTAKGVTVSTLVGQAKMDILSTKDLLVRPVAPRFFVVGDQARLEAVVNNNTSAAVSVDVRLGGQGVTIAGSSQQPLTVKANDKAKVGWDVTVAPVDSVVLTFSADGGGYSDAVEMTLPVLRPSSAETVATAGQVETTIQETVLLPASADRTAGELQLSFSPSLAAAAMDSLEYLRAFDYECTEQVVTKFFPNAVTYLALKRMGVARDDLRKQLESAINTAVPRLYLLQNRDGGWGWWSGEASRPNLSAYALQALVTARQAGFAVDAAVTTRAEQYLVGTLKQAIATKPSAYNERAFVLYVLGEVGRKDTLSYAVNLFDQRTNLDLYGKALLAMTFQRAGQAQARTLVTELTSAAIVSATGSHWEEKRPDYVGMNTDTRTTALAIMTLTRVDPKNPLLVNAVRWLMSARQQTHWDTTQTTAYGILALTGYMESTGELSGSYTYGIQFNGKVLGDGSVTSQNVMDTRKVTVAIKDLVQNAANDLVITRGTGQGRLYYSAYLNYYLPAEKMAALNRGILVGRQYFAVDGQTLKPTDRQIESAQIGDYVQVRLTLIAPTDLQYLVLEDALPAGFEAVNNSLKTSTVAAASPILKSGVPVAPSAPSIGRYGQPYWFYWAHTEIRDERVAVFATTLGRGSYEYSYIIRASLAGQFRAMPARAWEMYFPEVFGRSNGIVFTVRP